jgi:hypothetical protein
LLADRADFLNIIEKWNVAESARDTGGFGGAVSDG